MGIAYETLDMISKIITEYLKPSDNDMMTQLNRIHDVLKTLDLYNPNNLKSTFVLYRFDNALTGDEVLPGN